MYKNDTVRITLHALEHDPAVEVGTLDHAGIPVVACDRGVLIGLRELAEGGTACAIDPVSTKASDQTSFEAWIGLTEHLVKHWGAQEASGLKEVLSKILTRAEQQERDHGTPHT